MSVVTKPFRVSFPVVFTPKPTKKGGDPKYSISMLFPPGTDLSALKKEAENAVKEKWGEKPPSKLKSPFLDAGEYEYEGYEEGWTLIRATSIQKPGIIDATKKQIDNPADLYPGCWARAEVRAFTYDVDGNRGVSFGVSNIQKVKDDTNIGGNRRPEDVFEALEVEDGKSAASMFY